MPGFIGREVGDEIDRAVKHMGVKLKKVVVEGEEEEYEEMREV